MDMRNFLQIALFITLVGCATSCVREAQFSDIPAIEFLGQSKNEISQGALMEDSLYVRFSFQDGDGDIGDAENINVFLTDTRQNFATEFRIPDLAENTTGLGIEGEVTMLIFTTCCLYDDNSQAPCTPSTSQPTDEVIYTLQIQDRAGNLSNIIELDPITVRCD